MLSVTPTSGMINAQQRSGNELIQLTFNPRLEQCSIVKYQLIAFPAVLHELLSMSVFQDYPR